MLARKTIKNEILLPEAVVTCFEGVDTFDVSTDGSCIILRPLGQGRADEVRGHLASLGVTEDDVAEAVRWARERE